MVNIEGPESMLPGALEAVEEDMPEGVGDELDTAGDSEGDVDEFVVGNSLPPVACKSSPGVPAEP